MHGNLILALEGLDYGDKVTFGIAYQEWQLENGKSRVGYDGFKVDFIFGGPTLGFPAQTEYNPDIGEYVNDVVITDTWNDEYPNVYDEGI